MIIAKPIIPKHVNLRDKIDAILVVFKSKTRSRPITHIEQKL
jgi:hypothetical protein